MLSFVAQRIVKGVFVLLAIIVMNFFLIRLAPGDPAVVMAGEAGASDPQFVAAAARKVRPRQAAAGAAVHLREGHRHPRSRLLVPPADAGVAS